MLVLPVILTLAGAVFGAYLTTRIRNSSPFGLVAGIVVGGFVGLFLGLILHIAIIISLFFLKVILWLVVIAAIFFALGWLFRAARRR